MELKASFSIAQPSGFPSATRHSPRLPSAYEPRVYGVIPKQESVKANAQNAKFILYRGGENVP